MHARELTIDELMAMKDEEIDLSDIPEADDKFWENAQVVLPQEGIGKLEKTGVPRDFKSLLAYKISL